MTGSRKNYSLSADWFCIFFDKLFTQLLSSPKLLSLFLLFSHSRTITRFYLRKSTKVTWKRSIQTRMMLSLSKASMGGALNRLQKGSENALLCIRTMDVGYNGAGASYNAPLTVFPHFSLVAEKSVGRRCPSSAHVLYTWPFTAGWKKGTFEHRGLQNTLQSVWDQSICEKPRNAAGCKTTILSGYVRASDVSSRKVVFGKLANSVID